jgi:hypothetical protein
MADDKARVDELSVMLGGDPAPYEKMVEKVIQDTERMAQKVEARTTQMVETVSNKTVQAASRAGTGVRTSIGGGLIPHVPPVVDNDDDVWDAWVAKQNAPKKLLGDMTDEELAADRMRRAGARKGGAAIGPTTSSIGGTIASLGPMLHMLGPELGAVGEGLALLGPAAGVATAALAAFTVPLVGVTAAIGGWEAVKDIPTNMLEGLAITLKSATFGWFDYTQATRTAKEGEAAIASQISDSASVVNAIFQERTERIRGLRQEVDLLKDHSRDAETAFIEAAKGWFGQKGIKGESFDLTIGPDLSTAFRKERVEELITALEKEAETHGMTKAEIAKYKAEQDGAGEAELKRIKILTDKMAAIDKAKEKEREHTREVEHARRQAEAEAKRAQEQLKNEAEALHKSLRTPEEKAMEELTKARRMAAAGLISPDDLDRVVKKHEDQLKPKDPKAFISEAHAIGSAEADARKFEAMLKRDGGDPKADKAIEQREQHKELLTQVKTELEIMNRAMAAGIPLTLAGFRR